MTRTRFCHTLGAGGKPSTWLPPGKLADLLNNHTVHVLSPHAHVIVLCVCPQVFMHVVMSERSAIFSYVPWCFPLLRRCFMGYLVVFPLIHAINTCNICDSTYVASSSGVHSTFLMHMLFPKRSAILLKMSVLLFIAVLLLSWAVLLYSSPFMLQSHVTSDIPLESRHLLVCTQHSLCAWCFPNAL